MEKQVQELPEEFKAAVAGLIQILESPETKPGCPDWLEIHHGLCEEGLELLSEYLDLEWILGNRELSDSRRLKFQELLKNRGA